MHIVFHTLTQCQAHMASHISRLGACSPYTIPSQRQHTLLWHKLIYRQKPWEQDVQTIYGRGHLQDRINAHYNELRRAAFPPGGQQRRRRLTREEHEDMKSRAYQNVSSQYSDRLKQVYADNLRQYVNHTTSKDGQIERFNVNMLKNRPFLSQVESALRAIFDACRYQRPYKMNIAFGFILYKMETDKFEQFFVVDHLARDPTDKVVINQIPNVWTIRNEDDEDSVIRDIQQTDFFDLLRDQSNAEQYNFLIVRMTHMAVDIFPVLNCDIHNEVIGNRQYIGRGVSDDENELLEDDDLVEDGDEYDTDDEEEQATLHHNPYILDEVDEEDDNEEEDDDELEADVGGRTKEERIRSYVQSLCRGTRNATLISLQRTMSQGHAGSRSNSAVLYKKLCFFAQVAYWHLKQDNNKPDEKAIREKALQFYNTYKYHFNIQSDDMFEGVHVTVVHLLEHIYKTRINVYEIHSLKKRPKHDRVNPKRETFANKYQPVIQPLYLSSSNGGHVYKRDTLNLLLHDNHYYTIADMNKLTTAHYRCISCGQQFKGRQMCVIKRHIQERCGKIRYRYRRGAVEPHRNMWEEAKYMFSIPDDILNTDDEDMLYTGYYATYDFEAMLHKENVADVEYSATSDVMVYDEHGEPCTEQEYLDRHEEEAYIIVNRPLSYAIACNVYNTPEAQEDNEFMELLTTAADEQSSYGIAYAVNEDPEQLIIEFVRTLEAIARVRRQVMLTKYGEIIDFVTRWFAEKYIKIDLTRSCNDSSELLAEIDHDAIEEMVIREELDDEEQRSYMQMAKKNLEICNKEIRLLGKLKKFINHLPILGFNSSGYDIPLIKNYLFPQLAHIVPSAEKSIHFVKKTSRYVSITVNGLFDGGGFVFLDIMQYLAPGFNLDTFIKSFAGEDYATGDGGKSYFPYEYMDSYERLAETEMPPYSAFYCQLRQENQLESEYQQYIVQKLGLARDTQKQDLSDSQLEKCPRTGEEKYELLKNMWRKQQWQTVADYLKYYNIQDVVPFLIGVCNYAKEMRTKQVDVVRDGISLPGLAKQILMKHVPHRSLYYIDNPELYSTIRRNEVGVQSIIFTRRNGTQHPYVKGFDANSLYLYCLGEGQYTGQPIIYKNVDSDRFLMCRMPMRRHPGYKHLSNKDSIAAEEYLDYIEDVHLRERNIHLYRQYRICLTVSEKKWLANKLAEHKIPMWCTFSNICVDGFYYTVLEQKDDEEEIAETMMMPLDRRVRHVVEFDGCYWHACEVCGAGQQKYGRRGSRELYLTREKHQMVYKLRYEILEMRGYSIHRMRECQWTEMRRQNPTIDEYCKTRASRRIDPLVFDKERPNLVLTLDLLEKLQEHEVYGILVCDIRVPDELKDYFSDFAPIIKHANINYEDIGDYMQNVADRMGIKVKNRRCVIDSYFAKGIALTDEYLVWLLNKGLVVDRVYMFIRYNKEPIFREFANSITEMRIKGDKDKHSEMPALMAKLIGNSAFGSTITNKDKHREVVLESYNKTADQQHQLVDGTGGDYRSVVASMFNFIKYEQIAPRLLEVERKHDKVMYDQLRYIAKTIFDRAKLSVLKFYYDFLKVVLKPKCFCLLETDTDSIYIATKYERFEDNIDPHKLDEYDRLKPEYFITDDKDKCRYGKRQPNRYKVECEGHLMLSLCSKSYCVFDQGKKTVKYSAKGVQKANFNRAHDIEKSKQQTFGETVINMYSNALATNDDNDSEDGSSAPPAVNQQMAVNRGLKRKYDTMVMYEQEKIMFTNFYCKRRVMYDGIHTVPLSI